MLLYNRRAAATSSTWSLSQDLLKRQQYLLAEPRSAIVGGPWNIENIGYNVVNFQILEHINLSVRSEARAHAREDCVHAQ
mmetsp:Transcript_8386/g.30936  ORF Transcript_8386/g.30936 Transcript_8386/m.30936 type:complete len:80 (+) Transcript_8386:461-700(+)